jgi:hypothetical protein
MDGDAPGRSLTRRRLGRLAIPPHTRDELPQGLGVAYYVEGCVACVLGDRLHEKRTALAAIPKQPEPEIGSLAGSPECSPGATGEREVQENDGIGGLKPDFDSVLWPEVSVEDPFSTLNKPLLQLNPLIARRWRKTWPPEELVQFDHGHTGDLAQMNCQRRFA